MRYTAKKLNDVIMTSNFILIGHKRAEIHSKDCNRALWRKIREIASLWPWPLTLDHQFQYRPSQCGKQPFSENRVKIDASVLLEFCSQSEPDTQTDTLQWKYNPSTTSWRCNQLWYWTVTLLDWRCYLSDQIQ